MNLTHRFRFTKDQYGRPEKEQTSLEAILWGKFFAQRSVATDGVYIFFIFENSFK